VSDDHIVSLLLKMFTQLFDNKYGSVLTACASDGDGHVATALVFKMGDPCIEKVRDICQHLPGVWLLQQKFPYLLVASAQGPEFRFPVGVWQAAHIKHEVGIAGQAVFETKGLYQDSHTNLQISYDSFNREIVSWEEMAVF